MALGTISGTRVAPPAPLFGERLTEEPRKKGKALSCILQETGTQVPARFIAKPPV